MTFDEFIKKYTGRETDFDGAFGSQCVDLYRFYVRDVLELPQSPPIPGAADIWNTIDTDLFEKISNTPSGVPEKGHIVVWNKKAGGGFGHVAIFIEGDINKFKSFDVNWPVGSLAHIQDHTYKNVIGWFRPKNIMQPIEDTQKIIDQLRKERDDGHNAHVSDLKTISETLPNIAPDSSVETILSSIRGMKGRELTLKSKVAKLTSELENRIDQLAKERKLCQNEKELLVQAKQAAEKRGEQLARTYTTLREEYTKVRKDLGKVNNKLAVCEAGSPYTHLFGPFYYKA